MESFQSGLPKNELSARRSSADTPVSPDSPRINFDEVAAGHSEVQVEFRGQIYRLRVTRNGKLILNK
ncbi:MAG: hemin uptake protein HemP [Planctomycetota bacterium]|nr:hemin uptake protein HemP [Planctomycetota bacterium]MDA1212426.1 hemin uptake protein HemP [Planctomycetota bacterium]